MTKRTGSFNEKNNKKHKTDEDLNDLWGEDLDIDDIDDCLLLASQVCEKDNLNCTQRNNVSILMPQNVSHKYEKEESFMCTQQRNISILTSYNAFKCNETNIITSTQITSQSNLKANASSSSSNFKFPLLHATSKCNDSVKLYQNNNVSLNDQAENEVQKLQQECVAKEGEASILRSQLKQIRKNMEAEHLKSVQMWTEKLNVAQKQVDSTKSELEFKNLEIANLKSKIIKITKQLHSEFSQSASYSKENQKNLLQGETCKNTLTLIADQYKTETIFEYDKPLAAIISSVIFKPVQNESYLINWKHNSKCSQYLEEDYVIVSELQKIQENKSFNLNCIYPDISTLMSSTSKEINSEKCYSNINRILSVTQNVIQNFHDYLIILENNTQSEDIEQLDNVYLKGISGPSDLNLSFFDPREWCANEMGIKSRQMISVVSEILPYSSYLQRHLLDNQSLVFKKDSSTFNNSLNNDRQNFDFLHLILSTLNIIGKVRKGNNCVGFLSAVALLLANICSSSSLSNCRFLVFKITKALILTRPPKQVIKYLSKFFVSLRNGFIQDLCKMPDRRNLKIYRKEEILCYNEDSCILQIYVTLYEDNFINKYNDADVHVHLDTLQFITNLLSTKSVWLYFHETNYCECIVKINNFYVKIMCEILTMLRNKSKSKNHNYHALLEHSLRTLNKLSFKFGDLIVVQPHYKIILESLEKNTKSILTDEDLEMLENLNLQEDIPSLSANTVGGIPFWK